MTTHVQQTLPFPWRGGRQCNLQLLIRSWICAPGRPTHYGWVDRGSVEYKVCPTLLHMARSGNRTPDLLILSPVPCPRGHMLSSATSEFHFLVSKIIPEFSNAENSLLPFLRYTIRTDQYRYTEWIKFLKESWIPDWNTVYGNELYDHYADPNENVNLAVNSSYSTIVDGLSQKLQNGWR